MDNIMNVVYAVQESFVINKTNGNLESKHDLRPAEVYGKIEHILSYNLSPMSMAPVVNEVKRKMKKYNSRADYILCVGNPNFIGIVCAVAAKLGDGYYKTLTWDRRNKKYIVQEINMN